MNTNEHEPKSETPETDAEWSSLERRCDRGGINCVNIDFARKLELERDQVRRERDEAKHKLSQFLLTKPEIIEEFLRHLAIRVDLLGTDMSDCDGYDDPIESVAQWIHSRHVGASQEIDQLRARVGELEKEVEQAKADRNRAGMEERRKYLPKIAELKKDKERLDWLESHPMKAEVSGGCDDGSQAKYWCIAAHESLGIRQAIDEAMKGGE